MKLLVGTFIIFFNFQAFAIQQTVKCEIGQLADTPIGSSKEISFNALLGPDGVGFFEDLVFNDQKLFEAGSAYKKAILEAPTAKMIYSLPIDMPGWDIQMVLDTDGDEEPNAKFFLREALAGMMEAHEPNTTLYIGEVRYYGGAEGRQIKVAPEAYCLVSVD